MGDTLERLQISVADLREEDWLVVERRGVEFSLLIVAIMKHGDEEYVDAYFDLHPSVRATLALHGVVTIHREAGS